MRFRRTHAAGRYGRHRWSESEAPPFAAVIRCRFDRYGKARNRKSGVAGQRYDNDIGVPRIEQLVVFDDDRRAQPVWLLRQRAAPPVDNNDVARFETRRLWSVGGGRSPILHEIPRGLVLSDVACDRGTARANTRPADIASRHRRELAQITGEADSLRLRLGFQGLSDFRIKPDGNWCAHYRIFRLVSTRRCRMAVYYIQVVTRGDSRPAPPGASNSPQAGRPTARVCGGSHPPPK
jgi:hypothetical protein